MGWAGRERRGWRDGREVDRDRHRARVQNLGWEKIPTFGATGSKVYTAGLSFCLFLFFSVSRLRATS